MKVELARVHAVFDQILEPAYAREPLRKRAFELMRADITNEEFYRRYGARLITEEGSRHYMNTFARAVEEACRPYLSILRAQAPEDERYDDYDEYCRMRRFE